MTFAQPFSDYEVLERVGAGSMGTVFRAHHKKLNRTVALKVLKPSLARDARYVDRLRREARIVASLNHPNIVTGYDVGQEGGYHYFVMEFVEGKSLRELLNEWGLFAEERVLDVAIQITMALDHAFAKGVIHRDIKPANILIDNENVVKLTDMGLAKGPDNLTITRDGATVGTPQYISPEQAKAPQDVDVRSDLYSLGATLFHMCTGQPPFRAETMANVLTKVLMERAPSAAGINPDLSDGLNLIIRKLLSKDPGRRYQTPSDLLTDLQRVRRSESPAVDIEELDPGDDENRSRKPLFWAIGAAVLISFTSWFAMPDEEKPEPNAPDLSTPYRREIVDQLRQIPKIGDKLKWIRLRRIGDTSEFQRAILATQRLECEQTLADELPSLFAAEQDRLERTYEELRWVDPESDLREYIGKRIEDRFGIDASKLSGAVGREYETGWSQVARGLPALMRTRIDGYRRDLAAAVDDLQANQREQLDRYDIASADSKLGIDLRRFDDLGPGVNQLPEDLRKELTDARGASKRIAELHLETSERELIKWFGISMERLEKIRNEDPAEAERLLVGFRKEMERDYPQDQFRAEADPWPQAKLRMDTLKSDIAMARRIEDTRTVDSALDSTYGIAVDGHLSGAIDFLRLCVGDCQPDRIAAHTQLLGDTDGIRTRMLNLLLPIGPGKARITGVRVHGGRAADRLEARRGAGTVGLFVNGSKVPFALLNMRELVLRLGGDEFLAKLSNDEKAGLALWYFLSGEKDFVALIDEEHEALFRDVLRIQVRAKKPGLVVANQKFQAIKESIDRKRWSAADVGLVGLKRSHPKFASEHAAPLRRFRKQIDAGLQRSALLTRLRERARPYNMQVEVKTGDDLPILVELDMKRAKIPEMDRRGWTLQPGQPIRFTHDGLNVKDALAQSLFVQTLLAVDEPVTVTLEVSFESENRNPRLVFVRCHGATMGIGLQRDGSVAVFPVDRELRELQGSSKTRKSRLQLQRDVGTALEASLEGSAMVLPGARHRFEFQLSHQRDGRQWSVLVTVDGVRLPKVVVKRSHKPTAGVTVTALEPVTVHTVKFRGRGRG